MIARVALLILLPITAGIALVQRRRLYAIIGMGVFSLLLAAVFFLAHAPDVAITEAAIGAALVTFVYVLAIRKTGRLTVAASEVPALLERTGEQVGGLEWEILQRTATAMGLDLVVRFLPHEEVITAVLRGEADIAAGGIVSLEDEDRLLQTPEHLPTVRFRVTGGAAAPWAEAWPTTLQPPRGYLSDLIDAVREGRAIAASLDLARFLALSRYDLNAYHVEKDEEPLSYTFAVSPSRPDIHRNLVSVLTQLRSSGELERMIGRHLP